MATATTKKTSEERSHVNFAPLTRLDLDIMEAFVVKEVETVELHVPCYPERQVLGQCTYLGSDYHRKRKCVVLTHLVTSISYFSTSLENSIICIVGMQSTQWDSTVFNDAEEAGN